MKLSQAIDALCVATRADGRSSRTVQSYREKLGHLAAFLDDAPVEAVTTDDLRRFVVSQMDAGLSPFTVSTRAKAMKRLFSWLEEEGQIESNPARRVKVPAPRRTEPKGVSLDDVRAMLATCGDDLAGKRDRAAIMLLLDSGCRAGGLCGLQVGSLDLPGLVAVIREKGGKSRPVMFTEPTAEALAAWLEVRPPSVTGNFFVSLGRGTPLTPSGLWQLVNRRARQAGIEGPVSVHGFRHTFARLYLLDGGDLGSLADLLGHTSVETTKRWYGLFTLGELQRQHREHSPVVQMLGDKRNDE